MLKKLPALVASSYLISCATAASAIAPVPGATSICGGFTANKYGISRALVNVRSYQTTARGEYVNWSVPRYGSSGYCFVSRQGSTTEWRVERGPQPETVGGNSKDMAIAAERACLNKAKQSGYTVFQQTAAEKAASFHFVQMKGKTSNGQQYSFTCRYNNAFGTANLENIQPVNPVPPRPQPR